MTIKGLQKLVAKHPGEITLINQTVDQRLRAGYLPGGRPANAG